MSEQIKRWKQQEIQENERKIAKELKEKTEIEFYKNLKDDELINVVEDVISFDIIDDMYHKGYIPKIYNGCYGGFGWSEGAIQLMHHISSFLNIERKLMTFSSYFTRNNDIKLIIKAKVIIYMDKMNHNIGDKYGKPVFKFIMKELEDFIETREYDGLESLYFDYNQYFHDSTKKIMESNDKEDTKLSKINTLLRVKIEKPIVRFSDVDITTHHSEQFNLQVLKSVLPKEVEVEIPKEEWVEVKKKIRSIRNKTKDKKSYYKNFIKGKVKSLNTN